MTQRRDSLLRSAGLIGSLTFLSRILGVARDATCAAFFGAGAAWDAFSFAFRIPNLFRRVFGEGALSAAFMPLLTQYLETRSTEDARRLTARVAGALVLVLGVLVAVGVAAALAISRCVAADSPWRLTLALTALLLPYALFVCLTALAGTVLNALRHFAAPALSPVVLNVVWIAAAAFVAPRVSADIRVRVFVLAAAILLAGVLQLWLQFAVLSARGFRWTTSFDLWHPEVGRVGASMSSVALGLAAFQLNVLLDGVIAISLAAPAGAGTFSFLGLTLPYPMQVGANSVLYYGNRLMQLPLGVFGIALATAAFPVLSRQAARQDWRGFSESVVQGLSMVLFVGIPAGVGLALLGGPIVALLFQRGEFTPGMAARTAAVVVAYSSATWAYCGLQLMARAFYSLNQQATPAKVAAAAVVLNLALNLALVWPMREAGLALATAVSAVAQVVALCWLLSRRVTLSGLASLRGTVWRTGVATAAMSGACLGALYLLPAGPGGLGMRLLRVAVPMAAAAGAFVAVSAVLRSRELGLLTRQLVQGTDTPAAG